MLELPEAFALAGLLTGAVAGKTIETVVAGKSPHKFAFFSGDPQGYQERLAGTTISAAAALAGMVELAAGDQRLLFSDGVNLRYHGPGESRPVKHQLLIEFSDGSALSASVQMYGQLSCFTDGDNDSPYYLAARDKPSPLTAAFDEAWFGALVARPDVQSLSLKAFLATQQRIPGFGNGVLQDILWHARLHPRRKVASLTGAERERLFVTIKDVLGRMAAQGGRDTENDLWGRPGGYRTVMSRAHSTDPCPRCGATIVKESYLGGTVYFCPICQEF